MIKLILAVSLILSTSQSVAPAEQQEKRLQDLLSDAREVLEQCEAPVNVAFCEVSIHIRPYYKKGSEPGKSQERLISLKSPGAPAASFHNSNRNPAKAGY